MFEFDVDPAALFEERTGQFRQAGISRGDVKRASSAIVDMWSDQEGGWVPEWARLANRASAKGNHLQASLLWGAAKFPSLASPQKQHAYANQLDSYLQAAKSFRIPFDRRVFNVSAGDSTTTVAAHCFGKPKHGVLIVSGGVDTWKMDLHRLMVALARLSRRLVVAVDMPGTGESEVDLSPDADPVLVGLVDQLRDDYPSKPIAFMGLSFGGYWAAKLAILGAVDAAVDIGGPTGLADQKVDLLNLPYGMPGIVANAVGLDAMPDLDYIDEALDAFSLRQLVRAASSSPLYAINGENDQYVPAADTTLLQNLPNAKVWMVKNTTHCAVERFPLVVLSALRWLRKQR
ncbi:MAG: alpha/beta fold hydrolase [Solirubrobacterales bacterium]